MKQLLFLLLIFCSFSSMAQKITDLPAATGTGVGGVIPIVQGGVTKRIFTDSLLIPAIKKADSVATGLQTQITRNGDSLTAQRTRITAIGIPTANIDLTGIAVNDYIKWDGTKFIKTTSGSSIDTTSISNRINAKQNLLVSGLNIRTVNGQTLLGSTDIVIAGGGGTTDTSTVSVITYGATGNGTTDDLAAFNAAVATGKTIFIPAGTYNISATVILLPGQKMYGLGRRSIIKQVANDRAIWVKDNCEVSNILFTGAGKAAGLIYNTGIFLAQCVGFKVKDCWFENFSGEYGNNGGGGIFGVNIFTGVSDGGQITNCFFRNNNAGLMLAQRAEFVTVSQCTFGGNTIGLGLNAGNCTISNCVLEQNATNIKIGNGTNGGHSVISNTICDHATVNNLEMLDVPNSFIFLGCAFNVGNISIINSPKIRFISCDFLNGSSFTITVNNSDIYIYTSRFSKQPTAEGINISLLAGGTITEANNLDF